MTPFHLSTVQRISWVAGLAALTVTLTIPLGYFFIGLRSSDALLVAKTSVRAEKLSQLISTHPESWTLQQHRLEAALSGQPVHAPEERSIVLDNQHELVVSVGEVPLPPRNRHTYPLYDSSVRVGTLEDQLSLRPLLWESALAALASLLLGIGVFYVFREYPLQALSKALHTLSEEQERSAKSILAKEQAEAYNLAKSQFLARVSHEIRTPLNGVLGMAELLTRTELNAQQQHFVETLQRSGQSLLRLIDDILDFAKIEVGKLYLEYSTFDLHQIIEDIVALHAVDAQRKHLTLTLQMTESTPRRITSDPIRVRQVLNNLVSNALKFTGRGGVRIDVTQADDASIRIAVKDTGIGIAAEVIGQLFQPFQQADSTTARRFGGTGLGLSIAKQLVEAMGGTVGVESEPDKGSTFWFTLPETHVESRVNTTIEPGNAPAILNPTSPSRVLLAEDNPLNQLITQTMLSDSGYQVTLVENGRQALAALTESNFDIVLMDCQMPEMDGYTTTRLVRQQERSLGALHTPIIALTANVMDSDREYCKACGMDDFISKPFSRTDLLNTLARWRAPPHTGPTSAPPTATSATAADPTRVSVPIIDPGALHALRALQRPGRENLISRIVDLYQRNAPILLTDMQQACANHDAERLHLAAHTLKSNSANVGASALSARCLAIEQAARASDIAAAANLLVGAPAELGAVLQALNIHREAEGDQE